MADEDLRNSRTKFNRAYSDIIAAARDRREAAMSQFDNPLPIMDAPKDGSEIYIRISGKYRAFWDDEMKAWVLSTPVHIESIRNPIEWWPVTPVVPR